jgi:surfeit locus 1 family protein
MQIIAFNRCWVIRWRWAGITLVAFSLLMGLAFWQLQRAAQKTQLLQHFAQLQQAGAISAQQLSELSPETADGLSFAANAHWLAPYMWLLDNQIVKSRIGYDVLVPMQLDATNSVLLVNLGWVAAPISRTQLPNVSVPTTLEVNGILRTHLGGIRLGQNFEDNGHWPMRIQQVDFAALGSYLKQPLYAGVIYQLQNSPHVVHYQTVVMPPERHRAYALQWFLLALAVLVVALAASVKKVKENEQL